MAKKDNKEIGRRWRPKKFDYVGDWLVLTTGSGIEVVSRSTGEISWEPTFILAKFREVTLQEIAELQSELEVELQR